MRSASRSWRKSRPRGAVRCGRRRAGLVRREPLRLDVDPAEAALEEQAVGGLGEVQLRPLRPGRPGARRVPVDLLDDVAQRPGEVEHRHPSPGCGQLPVRLGVGEVHVPAEQVVAQRVDVRAPVVRLRRVREAGGEGVADVEHAGDGVTDGGAETDGSAPASTAAGRDGADCAASTGFSTRPPVSPGSRGPGRRGRPSGRARRRQSGAVARRTASRSRARRRSCTSSGSSAVAA